MALAAGFGCVSGQGFCWCACCKGSDVDALRVFSLVVFSVVEIDLMCVNMMSTLRGRCGACVLLSFDNCCGLTCWHALHDNFVQCFMRRQSSTAM